MVKTGMYEAPSEVNVISKDKHQDTSLGIRDLVRHSRHTSSGLDFAMPPNAELSLPREGEGAFVSCSSIVG
jgi:hypothetical protein